MFTTIMTTMNIDLNAITDEFVLFKCSFAVMKRIRFVVPLTVVAEYQVDIFRKMCIVLCSHFLSLWS